MVFRILLYVSFFAAVVSSQDVRDSVFFEGKTCAKGTVEFRELESDSVVSRATMPCELYQLVCDNLVEIEKLSSRIVGNCESLATTYSALTFTSQKDESDTVAIRFLCGESRTTGIVERGNQIFSIRLDSPFDSLSRPYFGDD